MEVEIWVPIAIQKTTQMHVELLHEGFRIIIIYTWSTYIK